MWEFKFSFFVYGHINLLVLLNAKDIFAENGSDAIQSITEKEEGVYIFHKIIDSKGNIAVLLEIELTDFVVSSAALCHHALIQWLKMINIWMI